MALPERLSAEAAAGGLVQPMRVRLILTIAGAALALTYWFLGGREDRGDFAEDLTVQS